MEAVVIKYLRQLYLSLVFALLLGSSNGYIALFTDTNTDPVQVFPYRVEMLPRADQHALNRGIPIADEQELNRILEDYLS